MTQDSVITRFGGRLHAAAAAPIAAAAAAAALALALALGSAQAQQAPAAAAAPASSAAPASAAAAQAAAASAAAAAPTQHADALRLVDAWLDAQAAFDRVPALSAGIVIGQQTVWRRGWGAIDRQRRAPARSDTVYSICSISKLFTSIAVMQLWEDGKLSLDDDIGKLLPGFALQRSDPDGGPISVRALLSHSSGLPREGGFAYWTPPDFRFPTRQELLDGLAAQRTSMRPADRYQYSNLGMALLGEVVAAVSGMPYERYVQDRILDPLQLADTRPSLPFGDARMAQGFSALRRDGGRDAVPPFDARGLTPAAGFSSTVDDLARFAAWQFRLRKGGGREVLKVSTLREMQRVQWTDPDGKTSWGLGFGVAAGAVVGHAGSCPGYLTAVSLALNEEVAVIAMVNANDNQSASRYTRPMRQLMLKGLKLPVAPASGPRLDGYAGRYASQPWQSENVVQPWGAGLAVLGLPTADPASEMLVLRHVSGDTFRAVRDDGSLGAEFVFQRDAEGRVSGLTAWHQFSARLPAAR